MNSIGSVIGKALFVACLLISAGSAPAAAGDDGFAAFWKKFQAAVAKSDQKAVSQMIKYPVFYIDERQEKDFPVIWKGAFSSAQRRCLGKQKPVKTPMRARSLIPPSAIRLSMSSARMVPPGS